ATLSSIIYSTYFGGTAGMDSKTMVNAVAVDSGGNAWLTGWTKDATFPTVNSPVQSTISGTQDAFVAKLNSTGSALLYSTYLGATGSGDEGRGIAIDSSDNAYVVGIVSGTGFPTTAGIIDTVIDGEEAFLTKFSSSGAVIYSTLLGGSGADGANAVAVDTAGSVYVAGSSTTASSLLFTGSIVSGYDTMNAGGTADAFVAKLNASGTAYEYFTFLGAGDRDVARAIAVDGTGRAYVVGETTSAAFPITSGAYDTSESNGDGFITVLNATGTALVYSSFFGGDNTDVLTGVAVDDAGRIYVAGFSNDEAGFPTTLEAVAGNADILVAQINPGGSGAADLLYIDLHGGGADDRALTAAFSAGSFYIAGDTRSSGLATPGAYQSSYPAGDPYAGFAARYAFTAAPVVAGASAVSYAEDDAGVVVNASVTVSDADSTTLPSGSVRVANYVAGEDVLSLVNDPATMGNITATFDSGTGVLSLSSAGATATLAQWQAALRAVRYSNASDNPNTITRNIVFTVSDGSIGSLPLTSTVAVTAVNDAPVSTNDAVATSEDTPVTLTLADFGSYSDVEGSALAAVQITSLPGAGTLEYNGVAVTLNQVVSAADIGAGLLRFVPAVNENGPGYASIGFRVSDGTEFRAAAYTLTVDVAAVNDRPTSSSTTVATSEDTPVTLTLSDFGSYSDVEGSALAAVQITSLPGAGTLEYNGVAVTLNQVVSAADISGGLLRFVPAANENGAGYATIGFKVSDGTDFSAAAYTVTVDVSAVNDAPVSTNDTVATSEDDKIILRLSDFGAYSDVEGSALAAVQITALPTEGRLAIDNNGVASVVTLNQVISAADILAGRLRFTPDANESGTPYAVIGFRVSDGTEFSTAGYTLTVDVTAVNDAPVSTNDVVATSEDTPVTLALADFGSYGDVEGSALAAVQITSLPVAGTLQYNGAAVTPNQVVSAADISAGLLRFVPAANENGAGYASIGFKVSDGTDFSAAAYTLTVDVAAVNDLPTTTSTTVATSEDTPVTLTLADFGSYGDVEGSALAAVQITSLPTAGTLQYNGVAVTLNQVVSAVDVAAGLLRFVPAANENGAGYATVGFKVSDGTDFSAAAYTLTVDVA
ncbi:MAG TPA: Ig-like domain-containing protein, partial [Vicinamibacterales bacterium]|nr:Ig-like domain-containing protein [Vicinamibacterales bacterium]